MTLHCVVRIRTWFFVCGGVPYDQLDCVLHRAIRLRVLSTSLFDVFLLVLCVNVSHTANV